jgi:hypothetical protein
VTIEDRAFPEQASGFGNLMELHPTLPWQARLLYLTLACRTEDDPPATLDQIVRWTGLSSREVRRATRRLGAANLITFDAIIPEGGLGPQ